MIRSPTRSVSRPFTPGAPTYCLFLFYATTLPGSGPWTSRQRISGCCTSATASSGGGHGVGVRAVEPFGLLHRPGRRGLGDVALVGDVEESYYSDADYLRKLGVEVLPPVPFRRAAVDGSGDLQPRRRAAFDDLRLVNPRMFETPAAGTILFSSINPDHVEEIYGEAGEIGAKPWSQASSPSPSAIGRQSRGFASTLRASVARSRPAGRDRGRRHAPAIGRSRPPRRRSRRTSATTPALRGGPYTTISWPSPRAARA